MCSVIQWITILIYRWRFSQCEFKCTVNTIVVYYWRYFLVETTIVVSCPFVFCHFNNAATCPLRLIACYYNVDRCWHVTRINLHCCSCSIRNQTILLGINKRCSAPSSITYLFKVLCRVSKCTISSSNIILQIIIILTWFMIRISKSTCLYPVCPF